VTPKAPTPDDIAATVMDEEAQMKTLIPTTREGAAAYLAGIVDVELALVDTLVASGLVDRKALIEHVQKAPISELSCGGETWPKTEIIFGGGVLDVVRRIMSALIGCGLLDVASLRADLERQSKIWRSEGDEVRCVPPEIMCWVLDQMAAAKKDADIRIALSKSTIKTDGEAR
jgi:hypothetical protein